MVQSGGNDLLKFRTQGLTPADIPAFATNMTAVYETFVQVSLLPQTRLEAFKEPAEALQESPLSDVGRKALGERSISSSTPANAFAFCSAVIAFNNAL